MIEHELSAQARQLERWLFEEALPIWWTVGADHAQGGFYEQITLDGRPLGPLRRARVQARQIYTYATAGRMGWSGPWRAALEHGLDFFLNHYRRPDGLFRTLVHEGGASADDTAPLYDQAFALFALARARERLPDRSDLADTAYGLVKALEASRRAAGGGFVEAGPQPFQSNPHMHMLEAALAWREIDENDVWGNLADEIVGLCLSRFIDPDTGVVREFFTEGWRPAEGLPGRIIEPGHQFEWAWLLERWGRMRGREDARLAARRMFQVAVSNGLDNHRGVAINALLDDLSVHDAAARLWPQTERIKAAAIFAEQAGADTEERLTLLSEAARGITGLLLYFDTPTPGIWRDRFMPSGEFVQEPAPASSFYHIICATAELRQRIAPASPRPSEPLLA